MDYGENRIGDTKSNVPERDRCKGEIRNYGVQRELGQNLSGKLFICILLYCRTISARTGGHYVREREVVHDKLGLLVAIFKGRRMYSFLFVR